MACYRHVIAWASLMLWLNAAIGHDICASTSFFLHPNNTICPNRGKVDIFQKFGFPSDAVPVDLSGYVPRLLHEDSVVHHVDSNKAFVKVGSGHEGVVYRAEMKDSRTPIIVKTLRNKNFHQIFHEARILTYLDDVPFVPDVVGLLPTGPSMYNLSIVSEYIKNSSTIGVWFNNSHKVSGCQWLNISYQIAGGLRHINERYVLHNDLHHKNILIQWRGSDPKVYFIDFGDSTFRHGRAVKNFNPYDNIPYRAYLPPEVSYDQSTPASDIYSAGQNIKTIGRLAKKDKLIYLASECMTKDPDSRISVRTLEKDLLELLQKSCPLSTDSFMHRDSHSHQPCSGKHRGFHHLPLPILLLKDFTIYKRPMIFQGWHLAKYNPTKETVVIRTFKTVSFRYIRHCARVSLYLNDTSYVPLFKGVVFMGTQLADMALVQKGVSDSVTLSNVVHDQRAFNEVQRVNLLREVAKALNAFNQRHLGCSRLHTDDILITFINNKPSIKFISLGRMHYGRNPKVKYKLTRKPRLIRRSAHRKSNRIRFSSIIQQLLPEFYDQVNEQSLVNASSRIAMDVNSVSDWMFTSN
ncbi:uncharacterized protein LOC124150594 [Haliotis rufescens]|uniref:uncharacterized protein LOC124150594 n=1 Tax=Haliotis rufescens TaxID=6454 RepID=UPI00201F6226|nr:uncharacterized protein LOC124150594 [Haliotis rufescens]XP_046378490.2 uncharacterized protein LOC124150594 [Haliotis rufescens]XP_046378491.2 uncharacterized protein LOC124150594 [Haliotis rufescens]XP_046378492.2 uncharacterized protein LOC124150594 [Haliotis rufescens]XP_046378494.2 uncharacterized protein LOC124150594 [Haliotis rufescens]XP_046378495.2 uncharacterized protein LOC124150594 [Haliotis rufescens]